MFEQLTKICITWATNHSLNFGLGLRPVHLKWYHTRHELHTSEFSDMEQEHRPQYHTGCSLTYFITLKRLAQLSWLKYYCMLFTQMFLSRQEAETLSSLTSTSSSSMSLPARASWDTSESTNQSSIAINRIKNNIRQFIFKQNKKVTIILFSLSHGYFFRNGTGLLLHFFLCGNLMTAPLGLPRFLIFGGS